MSIGWLPSSPKRDRTASTRCAIDQRWSSSTSASSAAAIAPRASSPAANSGSCGR
jgi:hypothetical protein